ncbi:TetR family transcriptional regulator [Frankia sp. CcI49]|uniref:DNA-binding transcriptional regulator, AcrR family n=1 Tax=Parafrankia irregularis TaxID=795642 RepID=A0A0S4QIN0_9ACTN|nr:MULTISPECIES: TetR/AcrR family transcriptional regulator [Frankiaceae]KPM50962.1 TetR family transcriptional regulator [Frankia sp. R43]MBE3204021.1 TetR/AcrR family transcriptional regulator [Parafrankia sp. CH37]ONH60787.1 TetR family transcriptional regulator [Frankia sp. CcI49]CUU55102.1 DNA-binding transcriptional regulator, AcrR family [Parafrankia irregularis]
MGWAERAADRSPVVHRSRSRSIQQTRGIVDAARRLIAVKGSSFTTQELVKEAGVAMQTFYRHFTGKDQLLLAVIEDVVAESALRFEEAARAIPDPLSRLRYYLTTTVDGLFEDIGWSRFVTSEHWRLRERFPKEIADADQPFTDLIERELRAAQDAGLLPPSDVGRDAEMVARVVMSVFHHYAFAHGRWSPQDIGDYLWEFCLGGISRADNPRLTALTVAPGASAGLETGGHPAEEQQNTTP